MALATLEAVRKVFDRVRDADRGDGELLARYRTHRDPDAFGSLVRRHGPMVFGVCNRVLRDPHAADDAFQATFLVLARKADRIRPPDRLSPWLYGVAYRTAMKARGRTLRRQQVEQRYAAEVANRTQASASEDVADLLPIIDEQLNSLPEKYRTPLVLCGVQGLNKAEAAERLGLPEGTVSSRLARGREMLRDRLARRGVAVPLAALGTLFTAETLHAAVTPELADTTTEIATGSVAASPAVLSLSNEVLSSMTLLKLKMLCAAVTAVALAAGGFGLYAVRADEKKPAQPGEKPGTKPDGEKPKPANPDGEKPKPGGEKPGVKVAKTAGLVASVDAKENTITIAVKGDSGVVEKLFKVAPDAKVFIDGADAKLAGVPKNATAALLIAGGKEGALPTATEVRVSGPTFTGVVAKVEADTVAFEGEKPRSVKLAPNGKVVIDGKAAKLADVKPGDKLTVTLASDAEKGAILIVGGTRPGGDGDKPAGEKPGKNAKFGGKVASVDASARTIALLPKGNEGKEVVVKLTADAKITIDGKDAKIGDIPKGAPATFTLVSAKDGQLREANEVTVAGGTFGGSVKQIDGSSITVGNEKIDRVLKLLPTTKVVINGKDAKPADLKAGDRVMVTLTADESGAAVIVSGGK
jgi:RNA polymerase sigma factor (sigma-70 family)